MMNMPTGNPLQKLAGLMLAGLVWAATMAPAQDLPATNAATAAAHPPAPVAPQLSVPPLSPDVRQILLLAQAEVSDDMILAFIKNSGTGYSLNAVQILYLRQQDVSDPVIMAMLNRAKPSVPALPAPPPPPPVNDIASSTPAPPPQPEPTVIYINTIQAAPATTVLYPAFGLYPASPYYYWSGGYGAPRVGMVGGNGGHPGNAVVNANGVVNSFNNGVNVPHR